MWVGRSGGACVWVGGDETRWGSTSVLPGFRRLGAFRVRPLSLVLLQGSSSSRSASGVNFCGRSRAKTPSQDTNKSCPTRARARQMHAFRSATAAVMSAAGAESAAAAPAREAAGEVASETSDGHAVGGLLMLQPNTATPPTHHPMQPQPMYPPMHQAMPFGVIR